MSMGSGADKDWNEVETWAGDGEEDSSHLPALNQQVGGTHYTKLAIQPMEYSMYNKLDPLQHTIIKYVTRFRDKNGVDDLYKAKHCLDMLIEMEYGSKKL